VQCGEGPRAVGRDVVGDEEDRASAPPLAARDAVCAGVGPRGQRSASS
jgi:hypothetical protein